MLDKETFVPITGYEQYLISADGKVYSTKSNRLLTIHVNNKGYCYVTFSMGAKYSNKNLLLHRLVCFMFGDLPSLDSPLEVNHIDYNKENNSLENLEVLSKEEHQQITLKDRINKGKCSEPITCSCCGKKIHKNTKTYKCISCVEILELSEEEIEEAIKKYGTWVSAAKYFGLSDTGLRKRYRKVSGKDPSLLKKKLTTAG